MCGERYFCLRTPVISASLAVAPLRRKLPIRRSSDGSSLCSFNSRRSALASAVLVVGASEGDVVDAGFFSGAPQAEKKNRVDSAMIRPPRSCIPMSQLTSHSCCSTFGTQRSTRGGESESGG